MRFEEWGSSPNKAHCPWTSLPHSSSSTPYKSRTFFLEQMTPTSTYLYNACQPNSKSKLPTTSKAAVDFTDHRKACSVSQITEIIMRKDSKRNQAVLFHPQSLRWMNRTVVHTSDTREEICDGARYVLGNENGPSVKLPIPVLRPTLNPSRALSRYGQLYSRQTLTVFQ